jgi:putative ATP-dependent endonuclease of OLD family
VLDPGTENGDMTNMYISRIRIKNYRCFDDVSVEFNPGVNIIIGENNAGKTALLKAIGLLFDRNSRPRIQEYDFHQGIDDFSEPSSITVSATITSSPRDTVDDKALVATWLTKLKSPWEAQLTYVFSLAEEAIPEFKRDMKKDSDTPEKERFWNLLRRYLPKYVSRIYGGSPDAQVKAEAEFLNKFDYQFLDAIRDVESELFSGSNPLLRTMLQQVLDLDATDDDTRLQRETDFRAEAKSLTDSLVKRIALATLIELVNKTGAEDGGTPALSGNVTEIDLISALRLFITREGLILPANYNGLGYNNLIYISLVLASLNFKSSKAKQGPNAVLFPMLLIEEPEAHLHPSLQYKLLKYIGDRVKRTNDSRQVFVSTHSTHITAASELDSIICMCPPNRERGIKISYPGQVFADDAQGETSKKYVERYLDATKSNMLFAKGVVFVEGIAEQLLIPCLAEHMGVPIEEKHVALIPVGGATFKHFLPIFGATGSPEKRALALDRPVSCLPDADPMLKKADQRQRRKCWPYQVSTPDSASKCSSSSNSSDKTQYYPVSGVVKGLETVCSVCNNIKIFHGTMTFEYDLASNNACSPLLIGAVPKYKEQLRDFAENPTKKHYKLEDILLDEETKAALAALDESDRKVQATFATYYLKCVEDSKGEHAFDLAHKIRQNLDKPSTGRHELNVPPHIKQAIFWASGIDNAGVDR